MTTNPLRSRSTTPSSHSVQGRADEHEQVARLDVLDRPVAGVAEAEALQVVGAQGPDQAGVGPHLDVAGVADLADEIVRHRPLQAVRAHQHGDLAGVPCQGNTAAWPAALAPPTT